jgi:hypothetical protein
VSDEFFCGLLRVMIQRVASGGAAVAREFFCCARGCLFCSALPRAVPLLCAKVLFAIEWRKGGAAKRASSTGAVAGFLFSCTRDPRATFSDRISVDALNEEHPGRGNSKSKAKLALAAIVECVAGLEYLDIPVARLIAHAHGFQIHIAEAPNSSI